MQIKEQGLIIDLRIKKKMKNTLEKMEKDKEK